MQPMPLTVRRALELMGLFFLGSIIVVGRDIITPIVMAFFLAIMLLPIYRWLRKRKLPEGLAIFLCILFLVVVVGLLVWFFSSQISRLVADFPEIKKNVQQHVSTLSGWVEQRFGYSTEKQTALINKQNDKLLNTAGGFLSGAASSVTGIFIFVGLLP
ncbi:MAG: permease, partial [Flaviaesturariibacter sp.]|nr:permease [Flaviaesturariibacter sp.]